MKKYFLVGFFLSCAGMSFAQLNYTASKAQNVAGTYTSLGTSGTVIGTANFDNANSAVQNIGFNFFFNGVNYEQFVLSTNGFIQLGNTAPGITIYQALDSPVTNVIAPFNYDLIGAAGAEYRMLTSGTTGSQVCTIQFKHVADKTDGITQQQYDSINFQIKLYETSNIVEFIYGNFDPSINTDGPVTATCGIKGSSAANSVNAAKLSTAMWTSATFINGNYTSNLFNNRRTALPPLGRTFRFTPVNDGMVEAVYTLSKIAKPGGVYNHHVEARLKNNGGSSLVNYPVTLTVTGANTFTTTKFINIDPLGTYTIFFDGYSPWTNGNNTVTVSVAADDLNTNNSKAYQQAVNDSAFSYADNSASVGSAGFGNDEGMMLAQFLSFGAEILVTGVKVYITNNASNVGKTVYGVAHGGFYAFDIYPIYPFAYYYTAPYVIQNSDLGTYKTLTFATPGRMFGEFSVGLKQAANATAYYPVGYQTEGPPSRPQTFFKATPPYPGFSGDEFTDGRLMIEAITKIAPGAIPPYGNSELLASWAFQEMNSPDSVPAKDFHRNLASSIWLTRGPGAAASPGLNSFLSTGFGSDAILTTNTDYFQVKVKSGPSDTMSLTSITFRDLFADSAFALPAGFKVQFAYSLNGTNFTLIDTPIHADFYYDYGQIDFSDDKEVDLSDIPALQNITGGTTVTFRMYARGNNTGGAFGFTSRGWGHWPLNLRGTIKAGYVIVADPVVPAGADFYLTNCSSTATGSIGFTSYGNFAPGNVYTAKLNTSVFDYDTTAVAIGTLTSNANTGVINFTIPPAVFNPLSLIYTGEDEVWLDIWIESSTKPEALSVPCQKFRIKLGQYCYNPASRFRSKQSGNWNTTSTWEMSADGNTWVASTLIPDHRAQTVQVMANDSVNIITPVGVRNIRVSGKLKVLNGGGNSGSVTFFHNSPIDYGDFYTMIIDSAAKLHVISATASFDSVIKISSKYWRPNHRFIDVRARGKITIGDGSSSNGAGFYKFATNVFDKFIFSDEAVFEWNTTSPNGPASNAIYFKRSWEHYPILRLTKMPPGNFGSSDSTIIKGTLEINTPVTMGGTGQKVFRDGLRGTSVLTQDAASGEFTTLNAFNVIPPSADTSGATIGIIDGTLTLNLGNAGLRLANGITVKNTGDVTIIGSGVSYGKIEVQPGGKMTMDPSAILTIENADLNNNGTINGAGKIQFTGSNTSVLKSPGIINAKLELSGKQLRLGGNSTTSSIDLLGGSHLRLDSFHLNMRTGILAGDASNFIVTNDTGRLQRYVGGTSEVPFHIGIANASYNPVTIANHVTGTPDDFSVRVGPGVYLNGPVTNGNVDRTWFITDAVKGGSNVTLKMQWNTADQQPNFDLNRVRISQGSLCPPPINCSGSYFDYSLHVAATGIGSGNYTVQRSGIDSFSTNSFIVTSNPFVYTFTGNGDWNNVNNWTPGIIPPNTIPAGAEVIINHSTTPGSECFRTGNITVATGGKLTVLPGKKFRLVQ